MSTKHKKGSDVEEGNKLIAEFMGATNGKRDRDLIFLADTSLVGNDPITIRDLKYHSSWDWLMPVVEKIHGTQQRTTLMGANHYEYITRNLNVVNINGVWTAVITFIKWYNQNPHP